VSPEDTSIPVQHPVPHPVPQPAPQSRQEPMPIRAEPGPMEILRPDGHSYGMPPSPASKNQGLPIVNASHGPVVKPPEGQRQFDTIKPEAPAKQGIGIPARTLFEKTDR